jgi:ubiquinone/menaquinone biosynthesis C-methylase UbiE
VCFNVQDSQSMTTRQAMRLRDRAIAALRAQAGRPTGIVGRAMVLLMAHRASNRQRNAWAVSLLEVRRDDRVLEIGFGPGLAIRELSRIAVDGYIGGIDHSELMLRSATRRNADGLARGVVDLRLGSVDELPTFDEPFDKILAVNAAMFWGDPAARLSQLRRLLRPGGLIAIVHQPRGPGVTDEASAAWGRQMAAALDQAEFSSVRLETLNLKPAVVCALGINTAGT